jgi:PelA/Pel-15E family pectate lyase
LQIEAKTGEAEIEPSRASFFCETSGAGPASCPAAPLFMKFILAVVSALVFAEHLPAAIIGTNVPALPLAAERIASLPAEQQPAWKIYLERSARQMKADRDFLQAEMKAHNVKTPLVPAPAHSAKGIALDKPDDWYATASARRIADIVVSFQTPAGGWSKNLNMTKYVRAPGEAFAPDNNTKSPTATDFDLARDANWHYVGTFDNDATITQLRFLAKVIAATRTNNLPYLKSFLHGLDYVFASQYPNGGWPQVWPLEGGYHDAITLNDDAMIHVIELLHDVANGQNEFTFVPVKIRARAAAAFKRGINCILAAQIVVNGRRTVWCQQHDELTLQPASARNYEMPAQTSSESAEIVLFLMQLPDPNSNVVKAVDAAAAWFAKTKISGKAYKIVKGKGRQLIDAPGSGPIWARFYEIGTNRPIFGDRDKSIHDNVNEISLERRNGYGWYRDTPKRVLEHYARWSKTHTPILPEAKNGGEVGS